MTVPTPATRSGGPRRLPSLNGEQGAWRIAALFVLPYVLLGFVWLGSNPVGAAPDEGDHLVKALGMSRLDIGTPYAGPVDTNDLVAVRNASIARVVTIPARLSPAGYTCFAFQVDVTANCQPPAPTATGDVEVATALGAYPPFPYVPFGVVAAASSPKLAFYLGRAVVLAETSVLLLAAGWHLVTWLGRRALLGVVFAMTPMAVFCTGILNTSGLEIYGALGVAAVVVVGSRRPESLARPATQVVMLLAGSALILSRQLGIVTMTALVAILLAMGGWRALWPEVQRRAPVLISVIALLGLQTLAVGVWELKYDHPALLGPWASSESTDNFWTLFPDLVGKSIGWFGWLDTLMPSWSVTLWVYAFVALVVAGLILGRGRDRVIIVLVLAGALGAAMVTYSRVFFSVHAGLQGRHMIPLLVVVPLVAGVAIAERINRRAFAVLALLTAVVLPPLQVLGLWVNGKRYAVGATKDTVWFFPDAQWSPPFGWFPWVLLALVSTLAMIASVAFLAGGGARQASPLTPADVVAVGS